MKKRICVCAGSFDPVTKGHVEIIRRAAEMFDEVIAAVAVNPAKTGWLSTDERVLLLKKACADIENVSVDSFDGLTVEYARSKKACAFVRGIRNALDCESEMALADLNRMIAPEIETLLLTARPELRMVSSSAVREMFRFGAPWEELVPPETIDSIRVAKAK